MATFLILPLTNLINHYLALSYYTLSLNIAYYLNLIIFILEGFTKE